MCILMRPAATIDSNPGFRCAGSSRTAPHFVGHPLLNEHEVTRAANSYSSSPSIAAHTVIMRYG